MRSILKKIKSYAELSASEWEQLFAYIEYLGQTSGESYRLFRQEYGSILSGRHHIYLPLFYYGADALADFVGQNYPLLRAQGHAPLDWRLLPQPLHPYVRHHFAEDNRVVLWEDILKFFPARAAPDFTLPVPRHQDLVTIYEEGNPHKESGLHLHWQRLRCYSFISRLQTYRYLTKHKAKQDRFRFLTAEKLSGIFTNQDKSIYYFVYLTEADKIKAQNACQLLNQMFYG